MKSLFIIIPAFNGGETLGRLIGQLQQEKKKLKETKIEIVVVNNGGDEKLNVTVIKNKKNLGFAAGCNVGIRYALKNNADSVLLLNQDTEVINGFLQKLLINKADIVGSLIKFKRKNNWIYDYGGKIDWNIGRTYHLGSPSFPVDYVSGCCMLVKKEVVDKVGLFDERFFLYFEDADFCLRAKKAGFAIGVEKNSVIIHKLVEGRERTNFKNYHLWRSNFIFINKYLGVRRILGYFYLMLLASKMIL